MKPLSYDQVKENIHKHLREKDHYETYHIDTVKWDCVISGIVDSINENIDWVGADVVAKTDLDLPRSNMKARCRFLSGSEFKVLRDMGDQLFCEHKSGATFTIPREWVYLKKRT